MKHPFLRRRGGVNVELLWQTDNNRTQENSNENRNPSPCDFLSLVDVKKKQTKEMKTRGRVIY